MCFVVCYSSFFSSDPGYGQMIAGSLTEVSIKKSPAEAPCLLRPYNAKRTGGPSGLLPVTLGLNVVDPSRMKALESPASDHQHSTACQYCSRRP